MSDENPVERVHASPNEPVPGRRSRGWIAALAVAVLAAGVIIYKELGGRSTAASQANAAATPSALGATSATAAGSVLLFADPREAEESCGCGQIIRLVRGAGARGVAVREIAPESDPALERQYHVTVTPTVLFLDSAGREVARHVGEARETIDAIRAGLDRLSEQGR